MGIYRTNNPTEYDDVDGIIIDETSPPSAMSGVATNVVALVGQFQRGTGEVKTVGSVGELYEEYGSSLAYSGLRALQNKRFGILRIVRVIPTGAAASALTVDNGAGTPVDVITFTSKSQGTYGNSIKVTVSAGTTAGKRYVIEDTSAGTVMQREIYDNVDLTAFASEAEANASNPFSASRLVNAEILDVGTNPANLAATPLAGGADGTVGDTDYQAALAKIAFEGAANIVFLDEYNATRNGYLKTHAAAVQERMVIVSHAENDDPATAITAAGGLRDNDGRNIFAYNWIRTTIGGQQVYTSPASWYASILSQTAPNIDPAFVNNSQFLAGATGLKRNLTRADFIALAAAGVSAFEFDPDVGYKIKSGVTTHILNSEKVPVLRRRMTDYLTNAAARFLKNYQNAVNSVDNRRAVKAAILTFVQSQQAVGILPRDTDIKSGKVTLVDIDSLNTDSAIAAGFFYVIWKQRIFSSMRYIVLKAEIGTSVAVTEG